MLPCSWKNWVFELNQSIKETVLELGTAFGYQQIETVNLKRPFPFYSEHGAVFRYQQAVLKSLKYHFQKQPLGVFYIKKGVLRNFAKLTGKHLCQSLYFSWPEACNFIKKDTLAQVFYITPPGDWFCSSKKQFCFVLTAKFLLLKVDLCLWLDC